MQTLGDVLRHQVRERPRKVAFEAQGCATTFEEFNGRVNRLSNALAALGVRPGSRVAILSRNRTEYLETYGVTRCGFIVVPLNWRLAPAELGSLIVHSGAEALIVDETHREIVDALRESLPDVKHYVLMGPSRTGWTGYEALLEASADHEPDSRAGSEDVLCLMYTSGTTGVPKGVAISHKAALGNGRTAANEILRLGEDDLTMAVMPLFHVGGMWYHLFPSFATGCTTILRDGFEPGLVLKELEARRVTNVHLVPTMMNSLIAHPDAARADLSSLRLIFYAASSIPPDMLKRAMQTFPRSGFVQSYGSTEAGVVTMLSPDDHLRATRDRDPELLASCGRPLPGHALRLRDDSGREVAQGDVGEIECRSPDLMMGYWLDAAATTRALDDGWLKTGDLGRVDRHGYLYIVDRKNDMIITGGENVYPTEVEHQLYRHPDVVEAAVFGIPDAKWVEKVVAAVVLKPGSHSSAQSLIDGLRAHLAAFKCPKTIHLVIELPKSAAGKILRKELRARYGTGEQVRET